MPPGPKLLLVPVLDVQEGQVVRGIAGRRQEYRPVASTLTTSTRPLDVARAFQGRLGLTEFYVADLDAIMGGQPALGLVDELVTAGFRLWVDAGVRDLAGAVPLARPGVVGLVLGLETLRGPEALQAICREYGDRCVFSLDLKAGRPLGEAEAWGGVDAWSIARRAVGQGVRRLLVLDLARIGVGKGLGTEALCSRLREAYPQVEVTAGGGVRDRGDLERLRDLGVSSVLLASALHDGRITRADVESLG